MPQAITYGLPRGTQPCTRPGTTPSLPDSREAFPLVPFYIATLYDWCNSSGGEEKSLSLSFTVPSPPLIFCHHKSGLFLRVFEEVIRSFCHELDPWVLGWVCRVYLQGASLSARAILANTPAFLPSLRCHLSL